MIPTILNLLYKYWKPGAIAAVILIICIYTYHRGYTAAETKYKLEQAIELQKEVARRQSVETILENQRARTYELETKYDAAVKADPAYRCVIPDSLRAYINGI